MHAMVPSFELIEIRIINKPPLPKVSEQVKVGDDQYVVFGRAWDAEEQDVPFERPIGMNEGQLVVEGHVQNVPGRSWKVIAKSRHHG
jgi:hypothetical protein